MAQTKVKYPGLIDFETLSCDFLVIAGGAAGGGFYCGGGCIAAFGVHLVLVVFVGGGAVGGV